MEIILKLEENDPLTKFFLDYMKKHPELSLEEIAEMLCR